MPGWKGGRELAGFSCSVTVAAKCEACSKILWVCFPVMVQKPEWSTSESGVSSPHSLHSWEFYSRSSGFSLRSSIANFLSLRKPTQPQGSKFQGRLWMWMDEIFNSRWSPSTAVEQRRQVFLGHQITWNEPEVSLFSMGGLLRVHQGQGWWLYPVIPTLGRWGRRIAVSVRTPVAMEWDCL